MRSIRSGPRRPGGCGSGHDLIEDVVVRSRSTTSAVALPVAPAPPDAEPRERFSHYLRVFDALFRDSGQFAVK